MWEESSANRRPDARSFVVPDEDERKGTTMGRRLTMLTELAAAMANLAPAHRSHLLEGVEEASGEDDDSRD